MAEFFNPSSVVMLGRPTAVGSRSRDALAGCAPLAIGLNPNVSKPLLCSPFRIRQDTVVLPQCVSVPVINSDFVMTLTQAIAIRSSSHRPQLHLVKLISAVVF